MVGERFGIHSVSYRTSGFPGQALPEISASFYLFAKVFNDVIEKERINTINGLAAGIEPARAGENCWTASASATR